MRRYVLGVWSLLVAVCAFGQANGKPDPKYDTVRSNFIAVTPGTHGFIMAPAKRGGASVSFPIWLASAASTSRTSVPRISWKAQPPPAGKTLHNGWPK